jgi:hypothetical protein
MAIRELFSHTNKSLTARSLTSGALDIESPEYLHEFYSDNNRFLPSVDYSEPKNFAHYGKASKYYNDSFNWIITQYPYDGSLKEKLQWHNSSSYLDLHIFDNVFPRTNGHIVLGYESWPVGSNVTFNGHQYASSSTPQFITVKGVMNTGSHKAGAMSVLKKGFDRSNEYKTTLKREANLKFNLDNGVTVEFWYKNGTTVQSSASVFFDLWNNVVTSSVGVDNDDYGRYTLELTGSTSGTQKILVTTQSGTYGTLQTSLGLFTASSDWNHYSVRTFNSGNYINTDFYFNGVLHSSASYSATIQLGEVTGALIANIGAFRTSPSGNVSMGEGWGSISGSIDEFRFWKTKRSHEQIGRFWFTQVGGGTNTDTANTDLGVYYKFNEGVTQTGSVDQIVLDYSGRVSNGVITNYVSGSRLTSSAMVLASASVSEFLDPIIYWHHPTVFNDKAALVTKGLVYDYSNNASLFNSTPAWIIDEDKGDLENLLQIMGSFFDSVHHEIKEVSNISNISYVSSSHKPYPFSHKLLTAKGFVAPELFANIGELEHLYNRDEDRDFEKKLTDTKNIIYQNVYNNLVDIYKSKGTETSFRNLIRCFGIGDEVIKINYYSDQETYDLRDNYKELSVGKKFIDFNNIDRFNSNVYQYSSPHDAESVSYISGSGYQYLEVNIPITVECEVFFPKKPDFGVKQFASSSLPGVSSSIFGIHGAHTGSDTDTVFLTGTFGGDFQVHLIKDSQNSNDGYFKFGSNVSGTFSTLTSSIFSDVYNNNKWNLAVKLYPTKRENAGIVSGSSSGSNTYEVEFYGVNTFSDHIVHEFSLTQSVSYQTGANFMSMPKRVYAGAHKTNMSGALLEASDVKISQVRYWTAFLNNKTIKSHARDLENFGPEFPFIGEYKTTSSLNFKNVPDINTLALNWDFQQVTGSDSLGDFYVSDFSSGSAAMANRYGFLGGIVGEQHTAIGKAFPASSTKVVDKDFIVSAKKQLPEVLNSGDMIKILSQDDEVFTSDTRPIKYFVSFEKSMYQTISEEILNWFSSIVEFNNFIGDPINKYQIDYNHLKTLRHFFFEKVKNIPKLETYINFYKWFDTSLGEMLQQLIPASANTSDGIRTVIENHILERDKYQFKYPTLEYKKSEPEAGIHGISHLTYDWKYGHAPIGAETGSNIFWWKERAERSGSQITSNVVQVDENRSAYLTSSVQILNRKFTSPHKFSVNDESPVDYKRVKKRDFYKGLSNTFETSPSDNGYYYMWVEFPLGYAGLIQTNVSYTYPFPPNTDRNDLNIKRKYKTSFDQGDSIYWHVGAITEYTAGGNAQIYFPFSILSSSVNTGYQAVFHSSWGVNVGPDLHHDTYSEFTDAPMQGHFAEAYEGGHKYRHKEINLNAADTCDNRPEGFWVDVELAGGTYIRVFSPHSERVQNPAGESFEIILTEKPMDKWYRDFVAKRPFVIKNIQSLTSSLKLGNYSKNYEVVHTNDRRINPHWFVKNEGATQLTAEIATLSGSINYSLRDLTLTSSDSIIVSKFAAPGEQSTMSRGFLDTVSEQYSAYSSLNYRNLNVKRLALSASTAPSGGVNISNNTFIHPVEP